jgi:hypothetical protein
MKQQGIDQSIIKIVSNGEVMSGLLENTLSIVMGEMKTKIIGLLIKLNVSIPWSPMDIEKKCSCIKLSFKCGSYSLFGILEMNLVRDTTFLLLGMMKYFKLNS